MADARIALQEDEGYLWRQVGRELIQLRKKTADDVPSGMTGTLYGPIRSAAWSDNRVSSVGTNWDRWYRLNEINSPPRDFSGNSTYDGIMRPSGVPANHPVQAQPIGPFLEGDRSVYFPGLVTPTASLIELPLAIGKLRGWSIEAIFRPDGLPQAGTFIAFNGLRSVNGYGMLISDGAGFTGSKLTYRAPAVQFIDTGITLVDKQWYHVIFVADDADNTLKWYVATITDPGKVFSYTTGSAAMTVPVTPVGNLSYIGGQDSTYAGAAFKGWISEVCFYRGVIASGAAKLSAQDRVRVGIEPSAPAGWLKADGINVSRNKYARLFKRYGTLIGSGDGSTTFELPNIPNGIIKT